MFSRAGSGRPMDRPATAFAPTRIRQPNAERFAPENLGQGNESFFFGFWMALWLSWRA